MNPQVKPRLVACPKCGKQALFSSENPFRPFCSERCKLIDFGHWASETYRVPAENETESPQEPDPA